MVPLCTLLDKLKTSEEWEWYLSKATQHNWSRNVLVMQIETLLHERCGTINFHLKKVFSDSELEEASVIRKFRITAADGKNYETQHYKLPAVIAVGYKVNSERAVQFRKCTRTTLMSNQSVYWCGARSCAKSTFNGAIVLVAP